MNADPTIPPRITALENRAEVLAPDRPGTIPIKYPGTGEIVHVPTDDYIQGEFVEENNKISKLGGDIEPLKNDNNENKRKIAIIEQNCCTPQGETKPKVELEMADITQFVNCDPKTKKPAFAVVKLPVLKGTAATETAKSLQMARVNALECKECDPTTAIATIPEHWQVRIEGGRPQLVYVFREKNDDGSLADSWYQIAVPHPDPKINKSNVPKLPNYRKGDWEYIITLKDNSKIVVNASDEANAKTMVTAASAIVNEIMLDPMIPIKSGRRTAKNAFVERDVVLYQIDYYGNGARNGAKPDWRKRV